jgi:hypothetical protein
MRFSSHWKIWCLLFPIIGTCYATAPGGLHGFFQAFYGHTVADEWLPIDAPNLLAWYDASDADSITLDGNIRVSQWNDLSGNLRHVSQGTTTSRPFFASQTIYFQTNNYLFSTSPFMFDSVGVGLFVVGKFYAVGTVLFSEASSTNNNPIYEFERTSTNMSVTIRNDALSIRLNAPNLGTGAFDGQQRMIAWIDSNGTNITAWKDATSFGSTNYTRTGSTTLNRFTIGGLLRATFLNAGSFEANEIVITGTPDTDTRYKIEGYLAHKWNLTANLPINHPYKVTAP